MPYRLTTLADLLNMLLKYASELRMGEQTILSGFGADPSSYRLNYERIPAEEFSAIRPVYLTLCPG